MNYFRGCSPSKEVYEEDLPCKDVTLGDCDLDPQFIIREISGIPLEDCQGVCLTYADCEIFRFNGTNCVLLTYDYRQECPSSAAPVVSIDSMMSS